MILLRQALRSVWRGRRSYMACVALLAIGVSFFIAFNLLFVNISAALESHYRLLRFADAFAVVDGMPRSALSRLERVEGVAGVSGTVVCDARVLREDTEKIITLRLLSFDPGEEERINDFTVTAGTMPGPGGVVLGEGFAAANGLALGDTVEVVLGGRTVSPVVTGFVQSPEYVYAIPDTGQLFPDDQAFGFGYLEQDRLEALAGKPGFVTSIAFLLEEGVELAQIRPLLEDALAPYGLKALTDRKNQASHAMLQQEVDSLGAMATSVPAMFILIAVIILYIMLKRIIEQERMQIGTLKAFGFSDGAILGHYLLYGGLAGTAGGMVGVFAGLGLTQGMNVLYMQYFNIPAIQVPPNPAYLAGGFVIAVASGVAGAFVGTRGILRLDPAEAMRPPAPPAIKGDLIGRFPFLRGILASHGFMAVRNIGRSRFRSAFVVIGLAFSFAITAFMASFGDLFDALMLDQFNRVELYNVKISLHSPAPRQAALEAALGLEGVRQAEGMLELPGQLRREHRQEGVSLTAIQGDSALYHLYDTERRHNMPLPAGGLILSRSLAEKLEAGPGDILRLTTPYTGEEEYPLPVMGVVNSSLGAGAYIRLDTLWELLGIPPTVSSLLLEAQNSQAIRQALKDAENVSAVTDQEDTKKIYTDMLETYAVMIYMMQFAGAGIALAIIRSTAAISLSERKREYATMRVLGMHPREIARVVGFEYWVLLAGAIPAGIALTRLLKEAMAGMIDNDIFSIPLYTAPASFVSAAVLCMAVVAYSNRTAAGRIARFDMVEVLKERE